MLLSKATYYYIIIIISIIQAIYIFCQYVCTLGIEPTTFALLTQCSNHWATGTLCVCVFFDYPGLFGGLNMVKNSWKLAHTLESAAIRTAGARVWHRGSTAPPGTQSENLMYSSHILARIHMKLGTHILISMSRTTFTLHFIGSAQ